MQLTDFGYARDIPEHTIAQSVVGTRHYVAPEVIEPGRYTETVDYWSIGVLTYEITCGIRPFLPHCDFRTILTNILFKPKECIAITEYVDDPYSGRFSFEEKIVQQNKCSPIFNAKIEKWLKLALDKDYKQRGNENGQVLFYSKLDAILKIDILTVYCISSCNFFYFDINAFPNILTFLQHLSKETEIPCEKMYLTLPALHPKSSLRNIRDPSDYYVNEWLDPYNPDNPPAMLYVANIEHSDFNVDTKKIFKTVPKCIAKCINMNSKEIETVPNWLLDQFERQVHFLLSEQHRHVECHMKALNDYIVSIEQDVFNFERDANKVHACTLMLSGQVRQFVRTVNKCAEMSEMEVSCKRRIVYIVLSRCRNHFEVCFVNGHAFLMANLSVIMY